ncbi:SCO2523 family variant P-loop protein [Acrocarpospora catenulata]|uniref:SCO2523 family variant P-loop protein n=1 Tax=Acrocarpospora catenulata TaxID=2836182 RepID=UPI001BDB6AB0|nr:SCO2523 family variant P-loop protein [Acrocarpospora catenulata]
MLVFAISDKGGTGRSVTSSNIVYRRALQGQDVCYLDFDFGSPTVGAIFRVSGAARGTLKGGLHRYLEGEIAEPTRIDVWVESDRDALRSKPPGAGQMVLFPGDEGGAEFPTFEGEMVERCVRLFAKLQEQFDLVMVDLSAGRSHAALLALAATARLPKIPCRWLVFHRWTRQHILAADGLVTGTHGLLDAGEAHGHHRALLADRIRFVRTAVLDPGAAELDGLRDTQKTWLSEFDRELRELASRHGVGRTSMLGKVPLDPVLQWREQLITDEDVQGTMIANVETVVAFDELAKKIVDDAAWEGL